MAQTRTGMRSAVNNPRRRRKQTPVAIEMPAQAADLLRSAVTRSRESGNPSPSTGQLTLQNVFALSYTLD